MYSHDGKMFCSVTGTTIDPSGREGYYFYTDKDGKEHHMCALAYTLFDTVLEDGSFNFENLPEESQKRYVWIFVGNPNNYLFGGVIRDKVKRMKDKEKRERKKLIKKERDEMNQKWEQARKMLKIALE